jgi:hypothetical protein
VGNLDFKAAPLFYSKGRIEKNLTTWTRDHLLSVQWFGENMRLLKRTYMKGRFIFTQGAPTYA